VEQAIISLGIDPGGDRRDPKAPSCRIVSVAWALVVVYAAPGQRPVWVDSGMEVYDSIRSNWPVLRRAGVGSVEWPSPGRPMAVNAVADTRAEAARVVMAIEEAGLPGYRITATQWRKSVLGRCRRTAEDSIDTICRRYLELLVVGIPQGNALNCHRRDACGVAITGGRMYWAEKRRATWLSKMM